MNADLRGNSKDIFVARRPMTRRRDLLVVRCTETSKHLDLRPYPANRTWDVMEMSFSTAPNAPELLDGEWLVLGGLSKWDAFYKLITQEPGLIDMYENFWLLDDDIEFCSAADVNTCFESMRLENLWVAAPGLTWDSDVFQPMMYQAPSFTLRFTNYIECMMPIFSREAVHKLKDTFHMGITGWGMDLTWWYRMGEPPDRFAIIDLVRVAHRKAMDIGGGAFYNYLRSLNVNPYQELENAFKALGKDKIPINVLGGLPRQFFMQPLPVSAWDVLKKQSEAKES